MARAEAFVAAPPEAVFQELADPAGYADWVVGTQAIPSVDPDWPAPGAAFSYRAGITLLTISDETVVEEAEPPRRLVLRVQAGPLPAARVTFQLEPEAGGTRVVLIEDVAHPALNLLAGPVGHLAVRVRNRETLRRLKSRVEGSSAPS
jgi:uncharacterized protein YndB with AHSA1/START domain